MVQEVRRIMFTQDELFAAFDGFRRMAPDYLPQGQIIACTPEENAIRVTIKSAAHNSASSMDYTFRGAEAVKPLLRFCLENNIMMPKSGQKSLFVKDGAASLYIVLNLDMNVPRINPEPADTPANTNSLAPFDILKDGTENAG